MGALTPCEDSRDKQEGKRLFFPSKGMENHRHFVYFSPPNFLSPSTKVFFACHAGTYMWLTTVTDPELQFSANSEKKKKKQTFLLEKNLAVYLFQVNIWIEKFTQWSHI